MAKLKEKNLLTEKEKDAIWSVINSRMQPDDRDPQEVIKGDFAGDEDAYLKVMAKYHNVPIGSAASGD